MDDAVGLGFNSFYSDDEFTRARAKLDQAAAVLCEAGIPAEVTGTGDDVGLWFGRPVEHEVVVKVLRDVGLGTFADAIDAEAARRDGAGDA